MTSETRAQEYPRRSAIIGRLIALPPFSIGIAYLGGYILLDWISFIHPYAGHNITPWNPSTGLSFVLVLLFGQRMIPLLFVAPFLADLVIRQPPLPPLLEFATAAMIGSGYSLTLLFLLRPETRFNSALPSLRDLFLLLIIAATGAVAVAMGYVGIVIVA